MLVSFFFLFASVSQALTSIARRSFTRTARQRCRWARRVLSPSWLQSWCANNRLSASPNSFQRAQCALMHLSLTTQPCQTRPPLNPSACAFLAGCPVPRQTERGDFRSERRAQPDGVPFLRGGAPGRRGGALRSHRRAAATPVASLLAAPVSIVTFAAANQLFFRSASFNPTTLLPHLGVPSLPRLSSPRPSSAASKTAVRLAHILSLLPLPLLLPPSTTPHPTHHTTHPYPTPTQVPSTSRASLSSRAGPCGLSAWTRTLWTTGGPSRGRRRWRRWRRSSRTGGRRCPCARTRGQSPCTRWRRGGYPHPCATPRDATATCPSLFFWRSPISDSRRPAPAVHRDPLPASFAP